MLHKATLSYREGQMRPYHVQCTCGTAGDFPSAAEAQAWVETWHFRFLGGISRTEFVSDLVDSAEPDAAPPVPAELPVAEVKKSADGGSGESLGDA